MDRQASVDGEGHLRTALTDRDHVDLIEIVLLEESHCLVGDDDGRFDLAAVEAVLKDTSQLGFGEAKPARLTKGQLGHLQRNNLPALRHLREFRVLGGADVTEGAQIKADVFARGERVDVIGTSKGRGFAGTIKRHNFNRQNKTHGQSDRERAPGSVGGTTNPGRTFKGQRMAGRMGNDRVTAENLEVVVVDAERNLLAVRGSVPGANGGIVIVKPARVRR